LQKGGVAIMRMLYIRKQDEAVPWGL
jgi:hypothetical protein